MTHQDLEHPRRPPNDRGQGRKPVKEGEVTISMAFRLTVGQREKLARLGGAAWLRERIDKARARDHFSGFGA